jgi:DNA ligase-associated metallophosphoesterase
VSGALRPSPAGGGSSAEAPQGEGGLGGVRSITPSRPPAAVDLTPPGGGKKASAAIHEITVAAVSLLTDPDGALYWPEQGLLAVADLHLEKGSSFAARGVLLPPYDTAATLARLARLITRYAPRCVIALGDSFHDGDGPARLGESDREGLRIMQRGREWIWITGNHDPEPADGIGGTFADGLTLGPLTFRHLPSGASGEISGHLHPLARISHRGRAVSRRCFASDDVRMVMPAFGAFTGGLNVRDAAFADLFGTFAFTAHLLGDGRLYSFSAKRCLPD